MPNVDSIWLKTKELLTYHYGCHSNLATIATRNGLGDKSRDHTDVQSLNLIASFYMRRFTTQIRKSLISTSHFSFTYFIKGFYYSNFCFMMFVQRVLNFLQLLSV